MSNLTKQKIKRKCECCERKMIKVIEAHYSRIGRRGYYCNYCYSTCENLSGLPRCHIERKRIGGYWTQFRGKNKEFIKW